MQAYSSEYCRKEASAPRAALIRCLFMDWCRSVSEILSAVSVTIFSSSADIPWRQAARTPAANEGGPRELPRCRSRLPRACRTNMPFETGYTSILARSACFAKRVRVGRLRSTGIRWRTAIPSACSSSSMRACGTAESSKTLSILRCATLIFRTSRATVFSSPATLGLVDAMGLRSPLAMAREAATAAAPSVARRIRTAERSADGL